MNQISNNVRCPASQELVNYIESMCPVDAHINVRMNAVYADCNPAEFSNQLWSDKTSRMNVVRSFSFNGITHWTLEQWVHNNGYACTLTTLSKAAFLDIVHS